MVSTATRRVCAEDGCRTILASYHDEPMCSLHRESACVVNAPPVKFTGHQSRVNRATGAIPQTRPGTMTARILEAMPGKATEISEATGIAIRTVRNICTNLAADGRATRSSIKRVGPCGSRTVYRRATCERTRAALAQDDERILALEAEA